MKKFKLTKIVATILLISSCNLTYAGTISPKDADIVSAINTKIASVDSLSNSTIQVTSHDGLVSLDGKVKTDNDVNKLIEVSESVSGVTDVDTKHLKAESKKHPMRDAQITAKIKGTFIREKVFGEKEGSLTNIQVKTLNGVVYLAGKVDNKEVIVKAVKLAMTIKGVKRIDSKLQFKSAT